MDETGGHESKKNEEDIEKKEKKEDSIKFDFNFDFLKNKKFQNVSLIVLLVASVFLGVYIRFQILPNLIDPTTGDYTPLDLDSYYFLRVSETLIENNGILPSVDEFRYPGLNLPFTNEFLPQFVVWLFKIINFFSSSATLNFVNVIYPGIAVAFALVAFFFLIYTLSKNKWIALLSSAILAIIPAFTSRTLSSDHEPLGIVGFFLAFLAFSLGMILLEKNKLKRLNYIWIGLLSGFLIFLSIISWGGGARFLYMILPLAFIAIWFTHKEKDNLSYIYFYASWIFGTFLSALVFGGVVSRVISELIAPTAILTLFSLGYIVIDTIIVNYKLIKGKFSKYRIFISFGTVIVLGAIFYQIFLGNFLTLFSYLLEKVITPFGTERVTLTVAENAQPYLSDWINQIGTFVFYVFLFGCFIVGYKVSKGIKEKKFRTLFTFTFALFVLGLLFTRISSGSTLNGTNFISTTLLFLSVLIFAISVLYISIKTEEWKIDSRWILIAAWTIPLILGVRSAIRVFFLVVPLVAFFVPLVIFEIGKFAKKSKDSLTKMISYLILIILIIGLFINLLGFYNSSLLQAKNSYPPYSGDWQNAMSWVRNETPEGSVFLHWWDYGYWVQTGGDRPTITDGGHGNAYWTHMVARYVMTTPNPDSAKSFMKTHDVSYFLMDPTDMGKYSAYSTIGDHENVSDRASYLPNFLGDPSQTQENENGTVRVYQGGFGLDSDMVLIDNGKEIFLPRGRAGIFAIALITNNQTIEQPMGVFVYNNIQYRAPLRYLFIGNELIDFGSGINSTVYIYPSVVNQQFDMTGAAMYLSEKTMNSLAVKLYLMNDPNNEYPELELVQETGPYPFNFYYQGFRGPIRIWEVKTEEMDNILEKEEFMRTEGRYGELDNLELRR